MHLKMKKVLCRINSPLQTKFSFIRSHESALGSFFADLIRKELSADCAILNSGAIRSDRNYDPGYLTIGDWTDIFPYRKTLMKTEVSGSLLLKILEQGISKYPALEGRFP
jgi:5'-nucleotidase